MDLLHHGVDITVIALWLGHESIEATQIYLHADMAMKEKALAQATKSKVVLKRYRPSCPRMVNHRTPSSSTARMGA